MKSPLLLLVLKSAALLLALAAFAPQFQGCAGKAEPGVQNTAAAPAQSPAAPAAPVQPATSGSLSLAASSLSADPGGQACVAVTARDFKEILSMQYSMKWDKSVLKFREVRGFGLPGLGAPNFGVQLAASGVLTYSWYDQNVRGISQPDGFTLYEVCFDVVGASGSKSYFEFTNAPTIIEIANAGSQFLELKGQTGVIKIK